MTYRRNFIAGLALSALVVGAAALWVAPASAAPVTINFWDLPWGNADYPVIAQKQVDQFNAEHPDIQVKLTVVPWTNWFETFVTAVASGSAPDVSTGASFQPNYFYGQGAILPLDDMIAKMKADGSIADIPTANLEAYHSDGHYIALPWAVDLAGWYYRKDILEKAGIAPPTNWDEFRAAAKAVTKDGVYGVVGAANDDKVFTNMARDNGGGFFTADGKADMTNPRNKEALEFLSSLVADGSVDPGTPGYDQQKSMQVFLSGKAAFMHNGPGLLAGVDADTASKVALLPPMTGPHGDKGTNAWNAGIMAYSQTKHPAETMEFIRWWSEHGAVLWTKGNIGMLPIRTSIRQDPYFQSNAIVAQFSSQYLPIGTPLYANAKQAFPQLNTFEGDGLLYKLVQQTWQGKPVSETLPIAQARVEAILAGQ